MHKNRVFATCHVEVSYEAIKVDDEIQYRILDFLNRVKPVSKSANQIAQDLDCSWQLVSKRAEKLLSVSLIEIDENQNNNQRKYYKINPSSSQILESE